MFVCIVSRAPLSSQPRFVGARRLAAALLFVQLAAPPVVDSQATPPPIALKSDSDAWLRESLHEYRVWRHVMEKDPEAARQMVTRANSDVQAHRPLRSIALGLKLESEGQQVINATLRSRGMLVWRTLETVIDRDRVDLALRELALRFRDAPASTAGFRKICEEITGRNLKWFFDYYITGTQLPRIELRRIPGDAPNEVSGEIILRNVPPEFQVRVELRLLTAGGRAIQHSVATNGELTPFTVTTPEPVTQITVDPDSRILRDAAAPRETRGGQRRD